MLEEFTLTPKCDYSGECVLFVGNVFGALPDFGNTCCAHCDLSIEEKALEDWPFPFDVFDLLVGDRSDLSCRGEHFC
jgi:hypothetical protein